MSDQLPDDMLIGTAASFGNSAHVILPKAWRESDVVVHRLDDDEQSSTTTALTTTWNDILRMLLESAPSAWRHPEFYEMWIYGEDVSLRLELGDEHPTMMLSWEDELDIDATDIPFKRTKEAPTRLLTVYHDNSPILTREIVVRPLEQGLPLYVSVPEHRPEGPTLDDLEWALTRILSDVNVWFERYIEQTPLVLPDDADNGP